MKKPQFEFDLELILEMVNNKGYMLKDVCEFYGCKRSQLSWFTKKHNLNFNNNINARRKQSELMTSDKNPTKGRERKKDEMKGISKANREKAEKNWEEKYKNGITYKQYSSICRNRANTNMGKISKAGITDIDHIYSLKSCWTNNIHPIYASDKSNLQAISTKENKKKADRDGQTLKEFLTKLKIKNIEEAQFKWPKL